MKKALTIGYDEDDNEIVVECPASWQICDYCGGDGASSAYLGCFTREDMDEDPEFFEEYMQGSYDRTCDCCHGSGKVVVADIERLTEEQQKMYEEWCREEREYEAMCRAERMAGA